MSLSDGAPMMTMPVAPANNYGAAAANSSSTRSTYLAVIFFMKRSIGKNR